MNYIITKEQRDDQVDEMLKWLKKEMEYAGENSTFLWNILNELRYKLDNKL